MMTARPGGQANAGRLYSHLPTWENSCRIPIRMLMMKTPAKVRLNRTVRAKRPNMSTTGQLGHRDQDPLMESSDSDFPEPGENEGAYRRAQHR